MNISSNWVRYLLRDHPDALVHVTTALAEIRPAADFVAGDKVVCVDASDSALTHGDTYTIDHVYAGHMPMVCLKELAGKWDVARFRPTVPEVDPVTTLLKAIDRGSWAEVLAARGALR